MDYLDKMMLQTLLDGYHDRLNDIDRAEERGDFGLMAGYAKGAIISLAEILDRYPAYEDELVSKSALVTLKNFNKEHIHKCIDDLIENTNRIIEKAKSDKQKAIHYNAAIKRLKRLEYYDETRPLVIGDYIKLFEKKRIACQGMKIYKGKR